LSAVPLDITASSPPLAVKPRPKTFPGTSRVLGAGIVQSRKVPAASTVISSREPWSVKSTLTKKCTASRRGRTIPLGRHERQLAAARQRQADPAWKSAYTGTCPKVEREIAHLMFRKHGRRRARVRGHTKVAADFSLLSAAVNLARLGLLGLEHQTSGWTISTA
jgi:hypothetical protein